MYIWLYVYIYIYRILYTVYTHMFVCVPPLRLGMPATKLAVLSRYLRIKAGIDILVDVFFARLYYLKIKLRSSYSWFLLVEFLNRNRYRIIDLYVYTSQHPCFKPKWYPQQQKRSESSQCAPYRSKRGVKDIFWLNNYRYTMLNGFLQFICVVLIRQWILRDDSFYIVSLCQYRQWNSFMREFGPLRFNPFWTRMVRCSTPPCPNIPGWAEKLPSRQPSAAIPMDFSLKLELMGIVNDGFNHGQWWFNHGQWWFNHG